MGQADRDEKILESLLQHEESIRTGKTTNDIKLSEDLIENKEIQLGKLALDELNMASPKTSGTMPSWAPHRIGRFEIRSVLGTGGFAVVYLAFDPTLQRWVGLKIPRPHALTDKKHQQRFLNEATASAKLDHPNIVPIYEAGQDGDLPYIACAWCDGPTLAKWQNGATPSSKVVSSIVRQLANAVHYSHEKGILHCDIKPGNVLLFPTRNPAPSEFQFAPKLADFGLAKSLESENETRSSNLIGTPQYMAPEVILGGTSAASVASDVYSLGALLYCLLVGHPPFDSASTMQSLRLIVEQDPVAPSSLRKNVDRDLSLICMKCLQKSPRDRYASAGELKEDIIRYEEGRPILARETPLVIRAQKWCLQRPLISGLLSVSSVLMLALIWLTWNYSSSFRLLTSQLNTSTEEIQNRDHELSKALETANQNKTEADLRRRQAEELAFSVDLNAADSLRSEGDFRGAMRVMARYDPTNSSRKPAVDGRLSFAWCFLRDRLIGQGKKLNSPDQTIWDMEFSPDGQRLAMCGSGGRIQICTADDRFEQLCEKEIAKCELNAVCWSGDSTWLAASGDDGIVRICNSETLDVAEQLNAFPGSHAYGIGFVPGTDRILVTGKSDNVQLWDAKSGELISTISSPHDGSIECMDVSRDGKLFATGGEDGQICVWRTSDLNIAWQHLEPIEARKPIGAIKFALNSTRLVATGNKQSIFVHDSNTGQRIGQWVGLDKIGALAVNKDKVVCGDESGLITELPLLQDQASWTPTHQWLGHEGNISSITISNPQVDSLLPKIISVDRQRNLLRWSSGHPIQPTELPVTHLDVLISNRVISWLNGSRLARCGDQAIEIFSRASAIPVEAFPIEYSVTCCTWAHEACRIVCATDQGDMMLISKDNTTSIPVFDKEPIIDVSVDRFARIAAVRANSGLAVVDIQQRKIVLRLMNSRAAVVSPDGTWLASAQPETDSFQIVDLRTLESKHVLSGFDSSYSKATFTQDSKRFIATGHDRTIAVWETEGWTESNRIPRKVKILGTLAMHPDGQTLACVDDEIRVSLLDIQVGRELATIWATPVPIHTLSFAEDGRSLAICYGNLETTIINVK